MKKILLIILFIGILVGALYHDKQSRYANVSAFPIADDIDSIEINIGGPPTTENS